LNLPASGLGRYLKDHRERLGISLDDIAASTKISRSLLSDLERDDVRRWPHGIFRRAFIREYALAVRLPADAIVREFARQFPEQATVQSIADRGDAAEGLRLTLAEEPEGIVPRVARKVWAAGIEAAVVVAVAYLVTAATGASLGRTGLVLMAAYPAIACAALGRTLIVRRFPLRVPRLPRRRPAAPAAETRELLYIVSRQADLRRRRGDHVVRPIESGSESELPEIAAG